MLCDALGIISITLPNGHSPRNGLGSMTRNKSRFSRFSVYFLRSVKWGTYSVILSTFPNFKIPKLLENDLNFQKQFCRNVYVLCIRQL